MACDSGSCAAGDGALFEPDLAANGFGDGSDPGTDRRAICAQPTIVSQQEVWAMGVFPASFSQHLDELLPQMQLAGESGSVLIPKRLGGVLERFSAVRS
jgi:hypothetical protein